MNEAKIIRDADLYWPAMLNKHFKKLRKKYKSIGWLAPFYGVGVGYRSYATQPPGQVIGGAQPSSPAASPAYPGAGGINMAGVPGGAPNSGMGPMGASKYYYGQSLSENYRVSKMLFVCEGKTVLVVDDDQDMADVNAEVIDMPNTVVVTDPKKAIELIKKKKFDIIVTDWNMGSLKGDDIFDAAKWSGAKMVLVSGETSRSKYKSQFDLVIDKGSANMMAALKKVSSL